MNNDGRDWATLLPRYAGLSHAEVARREGCGESTVRKARKRWGEAAVSPHADREPDTLRPPPMSTEPSPVSSAVAYDSRDWCDRCGKWYPEGDFCGDCYAEMGRELEPRLTRVMGIPDAHAPYHDREAWAVAMAAGRVFKPDVLVVFGDLFDFYATSFHDKDPRRVSRLVDEVIDALDCLDDLDALGARRKVFCLGNHEHRFERYVAKKAPALFGVVTLDEILGLSRRGWEVVPYRQEAHVGRWMVTHDLDKHGKNAALQAAQDAGETAVIGHVHRAQLQCHRDAWGRVVYSGSFGWLGSYEGIDYRSSRRARTEWTHGFGLGYLEPDGTPHIRLVPIDRGRCVVEGQLITRPGADKWVA